jgi:hypothetical protein
VDPASDSQYSKRKLFDFLEDSAHYLMEEENDVLRYYREFNLLSKPLFDSGRLTSQERDAAFMRGFHPDDCADLLPRLLAKFPSVRGKRPFPYKDVFQTAREVFADDEDPLFHVSEPRHDSSRKYSSSHCRRDWESDRDRRAHRCTRDRGSPRPERYRREDRGRHRRRDSPLPSESDEPASDGSRPLRTEMRTVWFTESSRQEEDRELGELVKQMHGLSVWDSDYASLYARCVHRFPNAARDFPKPSFRSAPSLATSYNLQTAPPPTPTARPAWHTPAPAIASAPAPSASLPSSSFFRAPAVPPPSASSFFRQRPRIDGCAFCLDLAHQIRGCHLASEYVATGRAVIIEDRMRLPSGRAIPNDSLGRGLKANIDDWLATQSAPPPPAPARTAFIRDSLPHLDSRPPAARIEEVIESHLLQVSAAAAVEPGPASDSEEDLGNVFNVFTAER